MRLRRLIAALALAAAVGGPAAADPRLTDAVIPQVIDLLLTEHYDRARARDLALELKPGGILPRAVELRSPLDKDLRERAAANAAALGIGVLAVAEDLVLVPYTDGAAWNVGLQRPGRLTQINGFDVAGLDDAVSRMAALSPDEDAPAQLIIEDPEKVEDARAFVIPFGSGTRKTVDVIPGPPGTLVLRVLDFSQDVTAHAIADAIAAADPRQVVLDLRTSSGGSLHELAAVAGLFLGADRLVADLSTDLLGLGTAVSSRAPEGPGYSGPLIVLTSRWSYSAAEILAMGLRQWRRAAIVGTTTRGKCLVQRDFPLHGELQLRLPVSEATFGGFRCDESGVQPTVAVPTALVHDDGWMLTHGLALAGAGDFACGAPVEDAQAILVDLLINSNENSADLTGLMVNQLAVTPATGVKMLCLGPYPDREAASRGAVQAAGRLDLPFAVRRLDATFWPPEALASTVERTAVPASIVTEPVQDDAEKSPNHTAPSTPDTTASEPDARTSITYPGARPDGSSAEPPRVEN